MHTQPDHANGQTCYANLERIGVRTGRHVETFSASKVFDVLFHFGQNWSSTEHFSVLLDPVDFERLQNRLNVASFV